MKVRQILGWFDHVEPITTKVKLKSNMGVYGLFHVRGTINCLYIGASANLKIRTTRFKTDKYISGNEYLNCILKNFPKDRFEVGVKYFQCNTPAELGYHESLYIKLFEPMFNSKTCVYHCGVVKSFKHFPTIKENKEQFFLEEDKWLDLTKKLNK